MDVLQNWFFMALMTPTLWAIGCLVDSCLIGRRIYRRASDGAIISCLFCILPLTLVPVMAPGATITIDVERNLPVYAIASGIAYTAHLFFYFRVLHRLNDVSGAETFMSLSVLIVPLFAWLILGEVLPARFYVAFIIAAAAVALLCLPVLKYAGAGMLFNMGGGVVCVSLSMVWQAQALHSYGFAVSTIYFNLACFCIAMIVLAMDKRIRRRILRICRKYPAVLLSSEALGILAVLASHRATQQGPSVSLVALIECLLPAFIIFISFLLIRLHRLSPVLHRDSYRTLSMQVQWLPSKIGALFMLMIAMTSLSI